ncbi:helix-turn-helix domain-containing protein [Streptomyces sp. Caat 7-52]|uniref:winged helix-turn-helix transcriptional regulator n=1 Tax=Streptomyces sp. Caat 7-52 TaxID=2949637 RepID=UPI0020359193|nr:helix-turn-helix domain-containing protein [Streptomyces sp. Caat 7-52]
MSRSDTGIAEAVQVEACPVTEVLDHVAGKWSIGILIAAAHGPIRFTEIERAIKGISRRMLTLNLRRLERDGLLVRTVYPTVPPRVEYELTPMARELYTSLTGLVDWAERHRTAIAEARADYDATEPQSTGTLRGTSA